MDFWLHLLLKTFPKIWFAYYMFYCIFLPNIPSDFYILSNLVHPSASRSSSYSFFLHFTCIILLGILSSPFSIKCQKSALLNVIFISSTPSSKLIIVKFVLPFFVFNYFLFFILVYLKSSMFNNFHFCVKMCIAPKICLMFLFQTLQIFV